MDVLLVTVDSLRYDAIFEGTDPASATVRPGLDAIRSLVDGGTAFTRAFSNAAYTAQSFRSILGGTYPWMYGSEPKGFQADRPHLAEELQAAGYLTAGFHSNPHLTPLFGYDRGFDYFTGREEGSEESRFQRIQTGIRRVVPEDSRTFRGIEWTYKTVGARLGVQLGGMPYVPGERLTEQVLEWVRSTDDGRPRFAWVHYMDVHNPYYPHPGTGFPGEDVSEREAIRLFHTFTKEPERGTAADVETLRRLYEGEVRYLDRCLGDLVAGLASAGMDLSETLVVFASDHGDGFGEHGVFFHPGYLYDELVHVPLVVAGPGFGHGVADVPVTNADLLPTVLSAAGGHLPDACVGTDLLPLVAAPPAAGERLVFAHAQSQATGKATVTDGRWKLIRDLADGSEGLFDRHGDPDETANRVDDARDGRLPDDRNVYGRLREALDDHVDAMRAHDGDGAEMRIDVPDDVQERLRQLGYQE
jgi:arylsulfatase A-like enzyme